MKLLEEIVYLQDETARQCPSGIACSELSGDCLKCSLNLNCVYGATYIANCTILEHIDCIVSSIILYIFILSVAHVPRINKYMKIEGGANFSKEVHMSVLLPN